MKLRKWQLDDNNSEFREPSSNGNKIFICVVKLKSVNIVINVTITSTHNVEHRRK